MKTNEYLYDLIQQKNLLAATLNFMGVDSKKNETLNTLVPKVLELKPNQSVITGGFIPTEDAIKYTIENIPFRATEFYMFCPLTANATISNDDTKVYAVILGFKPNDSSNWVAYGKKAGNVFQQIKSTSGSGYISITENSITVDFTNTEAYFPTRFKAGNIVYFVAVSDNIEVNYFDITTDGVLTLKADYQKDGAKNNELPSLLKIPTKINEIEVTTIGKMAFKSNKQIKTIILPSSVTTIQEQAFYKAINLEAVYNTENITNVGSYAFSATKIETLNLPNLEEVSNSAFQTLPLVKYINIGNNITTIPYYTFGQCCELRVLDGGEAVTSIGESAFFNTRSLEKAKDLLKNVSSIGQTSFFNTSLYGNAWDNIVAKKLSNCTFENYATPYHQHIINGKNMYSEWLKYQNGSIEKNINPNTISLSQDDERWANDRIGAEINAYIDENNLSYTKVSNADQTLIYRYCCSIWSLLTAYCGLKVKQGANEADYTFDTPKDLVLKVWADVKDTDKYPAFISAIEATADGFSSKERSDLAEALGLSLTIYNGYTAENIETFYNALQSGKYIQLIIHSQLSLENATSTHAVLIYGVDENGKILISDSSGFKSVTSEYVHENYCVYPQNITIDLLSGTLDFRVISITDENE